MFLVLLINASDSVIYDLIVVVTCKHSDVALPMQLDSGQLVQSTPTAWEPRRDRLAFGRAAALPPGQWKVSIRLANTSVRPHHVDIFFRDNRGGVLAPGLAWAIVGATPTVLRGAHARSAPRGRRESTWRGAVGCSIRHSGAQAIEDEGGHVDGVNGPYWGHSWCLTARLENDGWVLVRALFRTTAHRSPSGETPGAKFRFNV